MIRTLRPEDVATFIEMSVAFFKSEATLHEIDADHHRKTAEAILNGTPYAEAFMIFADTIKPSSLAKSDCLAKSDREAASSDLNLDCKPIGYALTAKTWSREAGGMTEWIEELYIEPAYRSQGYATAFYRYFLAEHPRTYDLKRLRLEICPDNQSAARLYQRWGFEPLSYDAWVNEQPRIEN